MPTISITRLQRRFNFLWIMMLSASIFVACLGAYSLIILDRIQMAQQFQSNAFKKIANNIELCSAQLDLTQEIAIISIQFSNCYFDNIVISQKSTKGVECIFIASIVIDNSSYIVELDDSMLIPAHSKSQKSPYPIRHHGSNTYMKSSEIKKLINTEFKASNQLVFYYTIQSCYTKNKTYDAMSSFTYKRNVCIKL